MSRPTNPEPVAGCLGWKTLGDFTKVSSEGGRFVKLAQITWYSQDQHKLPSKQDTGRWEQSRPFGGKGGVFVLGKSGGFKQL